MVDMHSVKRWPFYCSPCLLLIAQQRTSEASTNCTKAEMTCHVMQGWSVRAMAGTSPVDIAPQNYKSRPPPIDTLSASSLISVDISSVHWQFAYSYLDMIRSPLDKPIISWEEFDRLFTSVFSAPTSNGNTHKRLLSDQSVFKSPNLSSPREVLEPS